MKTAFQRAQRKPKIKARGTPSRRLIGKTQHVGPYELDYHATKGFRTRLAPEIAANAAGTLYRSFIGA